MTKTHTMLETEKEDKPFDAPLSITKREQLERQVSCSITPILKRCAENRTQAQLMSLSCFLLRPQRTISMCQTWGKCLRSMCRLTCLTYLASLMTSCTALTSAQGSHHPFLPAAASLNCLRLAWSTMNLVDLVGSLFILFLRNECIIM